MAPNAPTALLMTEFYQNLQKNPDRARALQQAMLTTMKSNPNPNDWAAFPLLGEAELTIFFNYFWLSFDSSY